ncbi:MAG: hypothetical protein HYW07_04910 [Candidatus Latescibacteria bacterium]|nr:hypothetical protein [Candidatus Latescibacterota bacterium]
MSTATSHTHAGLLGWLLLSLLGVPSLQADPNLIVDIEEATTPLAIDGDLSDWKDARWLFFAPGAPHMSNVGVNNLVDEGPTEAPGTATTAADLSGSFCLQWDEEWLYMAAKVRDNVHDISGGEPGEWYFKDSVSLFLDIPLDGDGPNYITGDHTFAFVADPTYPKEGKWWRHGDNTKQPVRQETPAPPQTQLALRLGERGNYTLEAAIPMSVLTELTPAFRPPFDDRIVGFWFLVADPDNGPGSSFTQLAYGGDDDNDAQWARLRFRSVGPMPAPPSASPALARLSFYLPPDRMAEFATTYEEKITPLLKTHGLVESSEKGRATPDSVFSRLFTLTRPAEVWWKWVEVQADPEWQKMRLELGIIRPNRLLRTEFHLYSTPAGPGRIVGSGSGKLVQGGWRQGEWQTFGLADGLLSLRMLSILQDREGNLWFGTADGGLSRYDGKGFTTFTTADGLADNNVTSGVEDRQGNLWFGTGSFSTGGGAVRYDGVQFKTFTTQDGLAHNNVWSILEDQQGNLWFGTRGGGVSRYDGREFKNFTTQDGLADNLVWPMLEDQQGNLWFGTDGGASRYDGREFKNFTTKDGLINDQISSILQDRQGNLWFGTRDGGLSRYDGKEFKNFTTKDGLAGNEVFSIMEDREGDLWFGTENGVSQYDGKTFTPYTTQGGLANSVMSILEDWEGNLWFGTWSEGISRYDKHGFVPLAGTEELARTQVECFLEDQQGNLWFGTQGKGVIRCDGTQFTALTSDEGLGYNGVMCMAQDRQGRLWFGTEGGGVSRYKGQQFTPFTTDDGLPSDQVAATLEDRQGNLWFGSEGGATRYDGRQFLTFTEEDGLASNKVSSIAEDRQGNLWFGTPKGASRYDGQQFKTFTITEGLPYNTVTSIAADSQGNMWFATDNGAARYDGQHFKTFTTRDGLASNRVNAIRVDQRGHLWFATSQGLSQYDGLAFQTLTSQDGLPSNGVQDLLPARNGDVWIATAGGITPYHPRRASPPVHVKDVVADQSYGPVKALRLPSSQRLLSFEFYGTGSQTPADRMAYVYRLQGHEEDWHYTREGRAEYADLPSGEYVFQVKAVDRDLNYSAQPATVAVEVFYQLISSPVRLAEVHLQDLFASFYKTYNTQALGSVQVVNDSPDSVVAILSFFLPDYMRRPSEQPLSLAPQSSQQVEVKALLDEQVLNLKETVPVQAEVSLAVASGEQRSIAEKAKQEILLHGRGALTWAPVGKAAAFITPDDPAVSEFARSTLVAFEEQVKSLGRPCRNLLRAMVLFEALKQHGVRYIPDANTPYTRVSADRSAVDHISYPAQVLQGKAGDCDDLTVLYGSLLENAGVSTALVDAPGHIFLLFDSGVSRQEVYKLPVEEKGYVIRGDRVWVPVEVTLVGEGFVRAWQAGAEEMVKVRAERERVVDTQAAWEEYSPASPGFEGKVVVPDKAVLQEGVKEQYATLEQQIDAYIEQTYLYPLKTHPDNAVLWSELARVYVGLGKYDAAIKSAYNRLRQQGAEDAATFNQLGIAHYLKGDLEQAGYFFTKAVDLAPGDIGIRRNLDKAMAALGEAGEMKGKPPAEVSGTEELGTEEVSGSKAGQVEVDEDSFYWGEQG